MTHRFIALAALASTIVLTSLAGCQKPAGSGGSGSGTSAATPASSSSAAVSSQTPTLTTAQAVLEKMAEAYRNAASYEDFGTLEYREDPLKPQSEKRANFSVAFVRPNKLHIDLLDGRIISDGKQWYGSCALVPDQDVFRAAPPKINTDVLRADFWLYTALTDAGQLVSPQLQLLLENDSLKGLVCGSQDVTLDEPGRLGDFDCYRVRFAVPAGSGQLWIDQKTFALRMFMVPLGSGPQPAEGNAQPNHTWLVINFERARLGGEIDPKAFQFPDRKDVKRVPVLVNAGPYELLGQKLPEFKFADLQGKPWTSQTIANKAAVIHFWQADNTEGHPMASAVQQLYESYKDNDKVAVVFVSLDNPDLPATAIEDAAKQLKITMPLLRDNGFEARQNLKVIGPPTVLFVDAKGVLQDCIIGHNETLTATIPRKLERVLAGENLAKRALDEFQQGNKEIQRQLDVVFSGDVQPPTASRAPTTPASKSNPTKLQLHSLWKCDEVRPAGNILVVPGDKPRILVVNGYKSVGEIAADGKLANTFTPKVAEEEFFTTLRSAAGRDGKRYFAAFAAGQQRFHLFDDKFQHLLSFPQDALQNRHAGISDVALGDLNGDGLLRAYMGFAGAVGVKCVSLQGTVVWSRRELFNVGSVVPGPANGQSKRELYCINDATAVAILDAAGQVREDERLGVEGGVRGLVPADPNGDGGWCCVAFLPDPQQTSGQFTAVGLNSSGEVRWKYAMPAGTLQEVEPVVAGRVLPGTALQWILPGCDGSVHILAADGKLIDRFNYGQPIGGLAVAEIDGKPVLLISSPSGVEALRVEQ